MARLAKGSGPLSPRVEPLPSEWLDGAQRERIAKRLGLWLDGHLRRRLAVLYRAVEADTGPAARGILFQVAEALGALPRRDLAEALRALGRADRQALAKLGLRLGHAAVYFPTLFSARTLALRALLWSVYHGRPLPDPKLAALPPAELAEAADEGTLQALGFHRFKRGKTAVALRVDAVERLAGEARKLSRQGSFAATAALLRLVGGSEPALACALHALGYRAEQSEAGLSFAPRRAGKDPNKPRRPRRRAEARPARGSEDSPFAKLRDLKVTP